MSDRFEASLESYLAEIFLGKLREVLGREGFRETLRLPDPAVTEFERGPDLLTLQTGHAGSRRLSVMIQSESIDVNSVAGTAAKDTMVEISDQLLGSLPWIDRSALRGRIEGCLSGLVP